MAAETREHFEPIAVTIAGSDSSGGAGIQADLKTFTANGVYGATVLTALTAQNTTGVQGIHPLPASFVSQQIASVYSDLNVRATKTGMLATTEIIEAVVAHLAALSPEHVSVVDPVMIATSGDPLIAPDAIEAVRDQLLPAATLVTPNLQEAAALLVCAPAADRSEMEAQALALLELGARSVLLKGGHAANDAACDVFADADGSMWFEQPWVSTHNTHGTGCTLSAAIAAQVVRGLALRDAIAAAKRFLTKALEAGASIKLGSGNGPVDHLFRLRSRAILTVPEYPMRPQISFNPSRLLRCAAWLPAVASLALTATAQAGPSFDEMSGKWSGWGVMRLANGANERIKCIATYFAASDDGALRQNLRCASRSIRIDATANLTRTAQGLEGTWQENVFSLNGQVEGSMTDRGFMLDIAGPGFTANLSVIHSRCRQSVTIDPEGFNVDRISLGLSRC